MKRTEPHLGGPPATARDAADPSDVTVVRRASGTLSGASDVAYRLVVVAAPSPKDVGRAITVSALPSLVGRLAEAELPVDDEALSRRHARVVRRSGSNCVLSDLGSTNGTFVNGKRVATALVYPGDRIQLGSHTVLELTAARVPPSPAAGPAPRTMAEAPGPPPGVRAGHAREVLAGLELAMGGPQRVRSWLSSEAATALAGATALEWLPVEVDVELARASRELLTRQPFASLYRQVLSNDLAGPILRPLITGARTRAAQDPSRWARVVPQVWATLFRGCGSWEISAAEPSQVLLKLSGPPPVCLSHDSWLEGCAAGLSALVQAAGSEGAVSLAGRDPALGQARFQWRLER